MQTSIKYDRVSHMAITKSAKKALRQNIKRNKRNILRNKDLKNLMKKARTLIGEKKMEEVKNLLPKIYKILDKAAKTGLIKKNTAARKKSRITKAVFKPEH